MAKTVDVNGTIRNEKDFALGGSTAINDIVWIDDDDTGKWLVLKNRQVYDLKSDIKNPLAGILDSTEKDFGALL